MWHISWILYYKDVIFGASERHRVNRFFKLVLCVVYDKTSWLTSSLCDLSTMHNSVSPTQLSKNITKQKFFEKSIGIIWWIENVSDVRFQFFKWISDMQCDLQRNTPNEIIEFLKFHNSFSWVIEKHIQIVIFQKIIESLTFRIWKIYLNQIFAQYFLAFEICQL